MVAENSARELLGRYAGHILDAVPFGVFISDVSGRTLYVNATYESLTGLKLKNLQGKNVRHLVADGVFDLVLNPEIVAAGRPVRRIQRLKNGARLALSGFPVFDKNGIMRLVVTFARDMTLLTELQEQVAAQKRLIGQISDQLAHLSQENASAAPVFQSPVMRKTAALLERFAKSDATILILGETGVGKDVFGQMAHKLSNRHDKVMLKVDCGGISETLTESELFGYKAGAFTGASSQGKAGYFELADGGTVFLDEVGELPLAMQTRLLRVLQDGEIVRVGSTSPRKVNTRIIAATNRDLAACVEDGTFRRDLFYRLNVATLRIPPLRERPEDIRPLAEHFLRQYTAKYRKTLTFMDVTHDLLATYAWPGNVRELQNLVHSLVITLNGPLIAPSDLPSAVSRRDERRDEEELFAIGKPLKEIMAEKEAEFLVRALEIHGSVSKVAELFRVDRTTIFRKLKRGERAKNGDASPRDPIPE